jgi:hypothetical protein
MALVFLLTLIAATPASAQSSSAGTRSWYQAYQDGMRAVDAQRWAEAIASLRVAKGLRSQPGRGVNSVGDTFIDYLPDYYLALAYAGAKQDTDARDAMAAVANSKIPLAKSEYDRLVKQWPAVTTIAEITQRGNNYTVASVRPLPVPAGGTPTPNASPTAIARGGGTAPTGPAQTTAAPVQSPVAQTGQPGPQTGTPPAGASTDSVVASNESPTRPPNVNAGKGNEAAPAPENQQPQRNPGSSVNTNPVTGRSGTVNQSRPPDRSRIQTRNVDPKNPLSNLFPPSTLKPEVERQVVAWFLSGQYEQADQLLAQIPTSLWTPRLNFYAACSRVALILTGQKPADGLDAAKALVAKLDMTALQRDRRFISPRILQGLGIAP